MIASATVTPETADLDRPAETTGAGAGPARPPRARRVRDLQATRPQTLSYALADSPVGQLAWIVERFKDWTDSTDAPEDAVDRDTMLTNVMIYWLNGTAGSSARYYYEGAATWGRPEPATEVPVAVGSHTFGPRCPGPAHRRTAITTSCDGPNSNAAATSRPWKNPTSSPTTCAPPSATTAPRHTVSEAARGPVCRRTLGLRTTQNAGRKT